jgi:hypothetical protein
MIYTVVWIPRALAMLAEIWNDAPDRGAVTAASAEIDRLLRLDPDKRGRRFRSQRLLLVPPLAVTFSVDAGDRMVKVLQVRRYPPLGNE